MSRYSGLKRKTKPRRFKQQVAATQKQFIRGIIFLLCVTLLIIFIFGDHGLLQLYKLERERAKVQAQIAQLRKERERVMVEKNQLENDIQYLEKLARERYRMVKPGEKVYKVIPEKKDDHIKN
ncbi:MAG: septum formation initiator family protein [Candidatus Neomarinimicrobiota bacterium]|nr:septum formation initiator family protein [Candidatus Neomarinimicrobiota bacterium]